MYGDSGGQEWGEQDWLAQHERKRDDCNRLRQPRRSVENPIPESPCVTCDPLRHV